MFKLDLKKAEEPEIKLPTSIGSSKKQESSRETSTSALLTIPQPLTMWTTTNWKILQEMVIPDHLTCLLRSFAGQEATVRTGHGTTDWFQIGKGICQGWVLSPCIFIYMKGTLCEMAGWMKHKMKFRLPGEISIKSRLYSLDRAWWTLDDLSKGECICY